MSHELIALFMFLLFLLCFATFVDRIIAIKNSLKEINASLKRIAVSLDSIAHNYSVEDNK